MKVSLLNSSLVPDPSSLWYGCISCRFDKSGKVVLVEQAVHKITLSNK